LKIFITIVLVLNVVFCFGMSSAGFRNLSKAGSNPIDVLLLIYYTLSATFSVIIPLVLWH
jgi:hypothetical protein